MAYVTLDEDDNVAGVFAAAQLDPQPPGYAEIPDDDPRITVFHAPKTAPISKRQMLLWLLANANKTEADVISALNTIADPKAKAEALITFNYPDGPFERSNPLFDQLGLLFQMTATDIDKAFIGAALL